MSDTHEIAEPPTQTPASPIIQSSFIDSHKSRRACTRHHHHHHRLKSCDAFWIPEEIKRCMHALHAIHMLLEIRSTDSEEVWKARAEEDRRMRRAWDDDANRVVRCLDCPRCVSVMRGVDDENADDEHDRRRLHELYRYVQDRFDPHATRPKYIATLEAEVNVCNVNPSHSIHAYRCVDYDDHPGFLSESTLDSYVARRRVFLDYDADWQLYVFVYTTTIHAIRRWLVNAGEATLTLAETEFGLE